MGDRLEIRYTFQIIPCVDQARILPRFHVPQAIKYGTLIFSHA